MAVFRVENTNVNAPPVNKNDEITLYQIGRYISSNEAAWRIFGFPIHERDPAVVQLAIHLENDIRKVNGQQYPTYKDACLALGLLEDDNQWECMLAEAALNCTAIQIRLLFAIVLTTCFPARAQILWENHKDSMTDDILHQHRIRCHDLTITFSDEMYNEALIAIEDLCIVIANLPLSNFGMNSPNRTASDLMNTEMNRELQYSTVEMAAIVARNVPLMNEEQRTIYDRIAASAGQGPPYIRYGPAMHVKADTDVIIYCPYSGYPIKEVTWLREDGSPVETGPDADEERGVLRLRSVRSTVAGGYICEVRAESGEIARRVIRLEVHRPPKIMPFNFPEEVEIGGSAQVTCTLVSGDKPIQFIWHKDGLPISPTLKVEQKNLDFFSLLIIQELNTNHGGEYTCRANNDYGVASHSATLLVKEATKNIRDVYGPNAVSVRVAQNWFKRFQSANFDVKDEPRSDRPVTDKVVEPPSWVWRAQNTSASAGAALLLPCSAKGQPMPRISWEYSNDGENWRHMLWGQSAASVPSEAGLGSVLSDGTVWLRAAAPQHEGWYRCTARAQHSVLRHIFYLDVREPPRLSRGGGGGESRWVVRGAGARLACAAHGEPDIHIHWTHDSRPLALHGAGSVETRDAAGGAIISEISIAHTGPEHGGEYRCHARNSYGSDELVFKLYVKERPSVPEEVRIPEVWSRRARVSWRATRGALVSHYVLQYRALGRDQHHSPLDAPLPASLDNWDTPDVFNLTLSNTDLLHVGLEAPGRAGATVSALAPDTRYALRAAALNDVGASPYTAPLHFTTREEAPGGAPHDVTVRATRPRELHVSWQPPPRDTWHGTLLGFTIRWWEASEELGEGTSEAAGTESGASAESTTASIRGLKPATRYAVTVRAYNAAGSGPPSPPHYRHTLESRES
ncbi:Down syndrome cell adhesion molecule homolog [Eumeta japonica]|uniref:Down syndrome cell adhesion molecule homolog n=1 Tax=Eumeta variegata TaxID=151549 RepID=A0A4C1XNM8_EUMVA|nr:Down syndrome cell adhesion molecule homolog [Eumeta japonica]